MRRVHAFGDDALGDLDAVGLADAIRAGSVGRAEIIEAAIARTEAVNPALNGMAHSGFERARAAAPAPGFFAGVPTFVKDNVDVAGQPSMHGADAWTPFEAPANSVVTEVFLGTGLTSLGKTQLSEFGFSASAEHPRLGPVRNPWDVERTAGASSSGRARSSPPVWCRSPTPTTAAAQSAFRPPATGWWGSSRHVAGCRWTRRTAGCPWASSPTAC